ncbi:MAG: V-type ATP synthase subunit I [Spirochaetaceae bacterium]|nr:V-type ATP synthase subunit I [Spirochaetaceae bacterium]
MKKLTILVMDKNRDASLEKIRSLGLVHIEKKEVHSEKLSALLDAKSKVEKAQGILALYTPKKDKSKQPAEHIPGKPNLAAYVLSLHDKRKTCEDTYFANTKEISRIEKWGDFDPAEFKQLADLGIHLIPYELAPKVYESLSEKRFIVLNKDKNAVRCLALDGALEAVQQFALPETSLSALQKEQDSLKKNIADIEKELTALSPQRKSIAHELELVTQDLEFETARCTMDTMAGAQQDSLISWIQGYVPAPDLGIIKRACAENGWALLADDPDEEELPPTLVKNNPFVRIIQPLFNFLGTIPGYREYDISCSYLIFFCLFFAMIFGDAAYGSVVFVIAALIGIRYKVKTGKVPDAVKLFGLLSICTIVWGTLNGAWFAMDYKSLPPFLQSLVLPQFNSDVPLSVFPGFLKEIFQLPAEAPDNTAQWNVQYLCFTVAIIQLVWAHSKNIAKFFKASLPGVAIAQFGWLVMMIGLYFLVLFMLLGIAMPSYAVYLIAIGLGIYFIFAEQKGGNPLVNVGKSFANFLSTFLNAVSSFADIISYIRLFAVGLAGTSIAQSFNQMSGLQNGLTGSVMDIVLKLFAATLILVFGHGLNLMMNSLSVVVHGVRLNLLEYAGNHLGMEWSGYSYKPFALKQKKNI